MKTNNTKKIIVSTLSIAMGAALVGSISGSVAWYQYSTRASASLVGTAVGTSRNLEVSVDGTHFNNYTVGVGGNLQPVEARQTGGTAADLTSAALSDIAFYDKPVYQLPMSGSAQVIANTTGYILSETYVFRVNDYNGTAHDYSKVQNVYLQDLQILNNSADGKIDISDAVKVHIESKDHSTKGTYGNQTSTELYGQLDLSVGSNGAGIKDTDGIRLDDLEGAPIVYGTTLTKVNSGDANITLNAPNDAIPAAKLADLAKDQIIEVKGWYKWNGTKFVSNDAEGTTTVTHLPTNLVAGDAGKTFTVTAAAGKYKVNATPLKQTVSAIAPATGLFVDDSNPYNLSAGTPICQTIGAETATVESVSSVTISIWLEGWGLDNDSWDFASYLGSSVEIVARFTTQAE